MNKVNLEIKNKTVVIFFVLITCMITNISQMSYFVDNELSSIISIVAWIICLVVILIFSPKVFQKQSLTIMGLATLFLLIISVNQLITGNNYWSSGNVYSLLISMFIYFTGCLISFAVGKKAWNAIILSYVLSSCVVALEVFFKYFRFGFDIASRVYAYDSKNSLSQILLTSIILLIFGVSPELKKKYKVIFYSIILGLFLLILVMKSRATLIGFGVLYIAFFMSKEIKKKYKVLAFVVSIFALFFVFNIPLVNKIIINDIIFAGRDATNLNDLSSGRVKLIKNALEQLNDNLLLGIGEKYIDCFPIITILQFGLFAGLIQWIIALYPIMISIKKYKQNYYISEMYFSLIVISCVYLVNGLFEALSPFGPGVKCYLLWLILGITLNRKYYKRCSNFYEQLE